MHTKEITNALRLCASESESCIECPYIKEKEPDYECYKHLHRDAACLIEKLIQDAISEKQEHLFEIQMNNLRSEFPFYYGK